MNSTDSSHRFFNHIGGIFLHRRSNLAAPLTLRLRLLLSGPVFRRPIRQHRGGVG